ncbi:SIR2 family protein [Rhodococcus sp. NPDC080181]|uniref:SIR2 family protein n=1 Tax=Rhodococcus sp. NPDC080181 TaxID=3155292 RepID=UPI0034508480
MTAAGKAPATSSDLFVFAGAGVSMSAPTSLPSFNSMRDAVLTQLGFRDYVQTDWNADPSANQKVIRDMAPEPFFGRLMEAGTDLAPWLRDVLSPADARANAAHDVLAELCAAGAKVWTVNFDKYIEDAAADLGHEIDVVAWPRQPQPHSAIGELLKPHGTLGGSFIITPADVLRPLANEWLTRLRDDLANSTHIVFVGYSGRDVDFQNIWRDVITGGQHILWFDRPGSETEREHKARVLRPLPSVRFPAAQPHIGRAGEPDYNPSWDFVKWCRDNRLVSNVDVARQDSLLDDRASHDAARPPRSGRIARARFAQTLGDGPRARRLLWRSICVPGTSSVAFRLLTQAWLNTPSATARVAAAGWRWIPAATPRLLVWRDRLHHFHLVQRYGVSDHVTVVSHTDELLRTQGELTDALRGLRWGSQKMLGNHTDVIAEAGQAARESRSTNSAVRCGAIFHWCHSLLWAGRFGELRTVFEGYFRPIAMITDTRWMAWADFIESCLLLADKDNRDVARALTRLESAIGRFSAEGNRTALVSLRTVQLTAMRLRNDTAGYVALAKSLEIENRTAPMATFGRQALILELAQGLAYRLDGTEQARQAVDLLCESQFPVHAVVASALRGQLEPNAGRSEKYLRRAREAAQNNELTSIVAFCDTLLSLPHEARGSIELIFP